MATPAAGETRPPSYAELLATAQPLSSSETIATRWRQLLQSAPDPTALAGVIDRMTMSQLMTASPNLALAFHEQVSTLLRSTDETVQMNAVQTLIPLLHSLSTRNYDQHSTDLSSILSGNLERSDAVFSDFVSAIDRILNNTAASIALCRRTLQLALLVVASSNQASLNAYFMRRDLFSTLVKFINDARTLPFAFEASILLGLLANYRKFDARNPYLVRLGDLVDEDVMAKIIGAVDESCLEARKAYTAVLDDSPRSFVSSIASFVISLTELVFGGSASLPPAVASSNPDPDRSSKPMARVESLQEKMERVTVSAPTETTETPLSPLPDIALSPFTPILDRLAKLDPATPSAQDLEAEAKRKLEEAKKNNRFRDLPPEMIVILLPFYELFNANKSFSHLIFASDEQSDLAVQSIPASIISLSSYVLTNAATSSRSKVYSRLCLILLMRMVEEGDGRLLVVGTERLRLCRQRSPMPPYHADPTRPLISGILDCILAYLRHNLRKPFDIEGYVLALQLLQLILQQLSNENVKLEYEWNEIWRSLSSLARFVRSNEKAIDGKIDVLIPLVFTILSFATYWSGSILPSNSCAAQLYYELLHSETTFNALAGILGTSLDSNTLNPVQTTIDYFKSKISEAQTILDNSNSSNAGEILEANEILLVIEEAVGSELDSALSIVDINLLSEVGDFQEEEYKEYLEELMRVICADTVALVMKSL